MKIIIYSLAAIILAVCESFGNQMKVQFPWDNGKLVISENQRFLQHENGKPFF